MMSNSVTGVTVPRTQARCARARGGSKRPDVGIIFNRGSESFRRLNPSLAGGYLPGTAAADLEPHPGDGARGAHGHQAAYPRVRLTVRSYRARLCDPDGISVKAAIDGLVEAGVIPDDSAAVVAGLTVEQVKCPRAEERTVIVVESVEG